MGDLLRTCRIVIVLFVFVNIAIARAGNETKFMPQKNAGLTDCIPVTVIGPKKLKPKNFKIDKPGKYCLQQDLVFTSALIGILPPTLSGVIQEDSGGVFGMLAPNVELDLRGHTLRSNFGNVGGVGVTVPLGELARNVVIKNGVFILHNDAISIVNSLSSTEYDNPHKISPKIFVSTNFKEPYQAARDGYISTKFILENLDITVGESAIFLEGNDNIIRNCKIRVKGFNAIQIFGNNVQIVNNEIIVESRRPEPAMERKTSDAPIMLRDGDNALISGNKITIKGDETNRPAQAISLRDSRNVRIENNQIVGAQVIYKAFDDMSTTNELNNLLNSKAK